MWSLLSLVFDLIFAAEAIKQGRRDGSLRGKQLWVTLLGTALILGVTLAPLYFMNSDQLQRHVGFIVTWILASILLGVGGLVITLRRVNLRKSVGSVNGAIQAQASR
jgi:hypothetical protein